ncbi:MAG TPA: efflux transporter outer membrane subunit, partial [Planctomycetota bacterium]|nr:efflux transporter outer membrane subunit [Planctomycetota bacterium]
MKSWLTWAWVLLAGCAVPGGTGGHYAVPTEKLTAQPFSQTATGEWQSVGGRWWEEFGDARINEWVELAQEANPSLRAQAQRVLAQEALARAVGGERGPTLDVGLDASRSFVTPVAGGDRAFTTVLRPNAQIAWQSDLFGRLKSKERSAWASAWASENDRLALSHSLIATVIRLRVALSVLDRRYDLAQSVVQSRQGTLDVVEGRYGRGVEATSAVDVRLARENLANAQANLPSLALERQLTRHALQELLGQQPGGPLEAGEISALPEVSAPPVGLPAGLLDRRPDLRAANFRTQAAAGQADVALAAMYPDLRLSASGGWDAADWEDLFDTDRLFGSLVGDLVVRLFGSGQLDANLDAARAQLLASAHDYRGQVLNALREVEDALASERYLREQLQRVEAQVREAQVAEGLARDRYAKGVGQLLTVLDTERRRALAQDLVLRLQQSIWNARIDLHLALGGDWQT